MTNADKIRAMTDLELVDWIDDVQTDAYVAGMRQRSVQEFPNDIVAWIRWIQSPVEGDDESDDH